MKVLVMGGTQFNGLALVHELVRAGHDVTICNRGRTEADLPPGVQRLLADRTDHEQLRAALRGTEWDCVHDISAYHPPDVESMRDILAGSIGHYVFASSTVIYAANDDLPITEDDPVERGPDQNEYGLHKILCEDILLDAFEQQEFPATIAAFSMVFGPHNALRDREQRMFARMLVERPVLMPGDGTARLQVGHVDDQARALEQLMGNRATFGKRYNLTGHEAVTRNAYVTTIAEVLGYEPEVVSIPAPTMEALWTGELELGSGKANVGLDTRTSAATTKNPRAALLRRRFQVAQLVQHLAPNIHWWDRSVVFGIDRLRDDTGWEPQHDFGSMVEDTYDWFCRAGLDRSRTYDWDLEDAILAELGA